MLPVPEKENFSKENEEYILVAETQYATTCFGRKLGLEGGGEEGMRRCKSIQNIPAHDRIGLQEQRCLRQETTS